MALSSPVERMAYYMLVIALREVSKGPQPQRVCATSFTHPLIEFDICSKRCYIYIYIYIYRERERERERERRF
jgi:hypothetical protein